MKPAALARSGRAAATIRSVPRRRRGCSPRWRSSSRTARRTSASVGLARRSSSLRSSPRPATPAPSGRDDHRHALAHGRLPDVEQVGEADRHGRALDRDGRRLAALAARAPRRPASRGRTGRSSPQIRPSGWIAQRASARNGAKRRSTVIWMRAL